MMKHAFAALMMMGTVGIGSAAGLGSAPIVRAEIPAPAICANHEDPTDVHAPGGRYITACAVGRSNGGAFADADGDGVLNGEDDTRTGGAA